MKILIIILYFEYFIWDHTKYFKDYDGHLSLINDNFVPKI